jgi:hypothetical protein
MLLLVAPHRLGLDGAAWAKGLGVAATFATCALVARWAWVEAESMAKGGSIEAVSTANATNRTPSWAAATAVACFASIPATAVHGVSGMETALFTMLLTAMFAASAAHVRGAPSRSAGSRLVACALLAGLTRPEGNLSACVVVSVTAALAAPAARRALVLRTVTMWIAPVAVYELRRRHDYGLLLPPPFYVKLATAGLLPGWPDVVEWLGGPALRFALLLVPAVALGPERRPGTTASRPGTGTPGRALSSRPAPPRVSSASPCVASRRTTGCG